VSGIPRAAAPRAGRRRLSRGWIAAIVVVAVLLVLWIASEIAIPRVASSIVKNEIKKRYPQAQDVSVSISAFPALRLAFKDYSTLEVKLSSVTLEGITFDSIVLNSNKWPAGTFDATVTPGEIMRFFSSTHSFILHPALSLSGDQVEVSGAMNIGFTTASVTATGNLEPRGGKQVFFNPTSISIAGVASTSSAQALVRQVMETNPVFVIREDLPFTVTAVTVSGGRLDVKGSVDLEKALNIKL
jgi:hypothetical protein